ncbi:gap junction beta-2 protein-like isoform X2 [Clavelina lepadiformis]|uniref:gap junction beta-2 protein-like isoform X2 n=1 Tax=Clavelina lepadiformis TaxID=159417 RepID=UPI004041C48A
MWSLLEKLSEQATKYSTILGQVWYLLVFLFRLIVVVTVGGTVYGDEQSAFVCSTKVVGCENICYNEFAKISHIRFWAFQLLAVTAPTVLFHFAASYFSGEIQKLRVSENQLKMLEDGALHSIRDSSINEKDILKMAKRKKSVGQVKVRRVYSGNELKEVPYTDKIRACYFASVVARIVIEGLFIYFGYILFNNENPSSNVFSFIWLKVPASYRCQGDPGSELDEACFSHFSPDKSGFVPCFVSRSFEKTVFIRYMNVLAASCFVISVSELIYLILKTRWKSAPQNPRKFNRFLPRSDPSFYSPDPSESALLKTYKDHFYSSLAVPVRISASKTLINLNKKSRSKMDEDKDVASGNASVKSYV